MFIAYSSVDICKVDKRWIPDLSPIYYGDNKCGDPKCGLKRKKKFCSKRKSVLCNCEIFR